MSSEKGRCDAHVLLNVHVNATGTTNSDANMIDSKILLGELTHILVEGSGEEQIAVISIFISVTTSHDLTHVFFPIVVQHLISLVNDGEANS